MATGTIPNPLEAMLETTFSGTGINFRVYRYGQTGFLVADSGTTNAAVSSGGTLATIPSGYRPVFSFSTLNAAGGASPIRILIDSNGTISPNAALSTGTYIRFGVAYLTSK